MNPSQFDRLVRAFDNRASRRSAIGGIFGGAGTLFSLAAGPDGEAKRRKKKNKKGCHGKKKRCVGECISRKSVCCKAVGDFWCEKGHTCCPPDSVFPGGSCAVGKKRVCCNNGTSCPDNNTCCPNGTCSPEGFECAADAATVSRGASRPKNQAMNAIAR